MQTFYQHSDSPGSRNINFTSSGVLDMPNAHVKQTLPEGMFVGTKVEKASFKEVSLLLKESFQKIEKLREDLKFVEDDISPHVDCTDQIQSLTTEIDTLEKDVKLCSDALEYLEESMEFSRDVEKIMELRSKVEDEDWDFMKKLNAVITPGSGTFQYCNFYVEFLKE